MEVMEQTNKRTVVSYKAADIKQDVMKGLIAITTFTKENKYRLTVGEKEVALDPFDLVTKFTIDIEGAIVLASKSTKKRILNHISSLKRGITLKKINRFLNFLNTKVLKDAEMPKYHFIISEKETQIQEARAIWVTLRDSAEAALKEYKETKGDFYKAKKG